MGFVKRIFTPPGTGGAEAAQIQQTAAAQQMATATTQMANRPVDAMPATPTTPTNAPTPPVFVPQGAPGTKSRAKTSGGGGGGPFSGLGAPPLQGQTGTKTLMGM